MNEFGDTAVRAQLLSIRAPTDASNTGHRRFVCSLNHPTCAVKACLAKTINVSSAEDPSGQSEEFLELANGCLCCSIKDTGVAAIEKLMMKKGLFDYIVLETTGLADPGTVYLLLASFLTSTRGPIATMFWRNEEYATGLADIVLDGVLCVVDAVFGLKVSRTRIQILAFHSRG